MSDPLGLNDQDLRIDDNILDGADQTVAAWRKHYRAAGVSDGEADALLDALFSQEGVWRREYAIAHGTVTFRTRGPTHASLESRRLQQLGLASGSVEARELNRLRLGGSLEAVRLGDVAWARESTGDWGRDTVSALAWIEKTLPEPLQRAFLYALGDFDRRVDAVLSAGAVEGFLRPAGDNS